MASRKGIDQHSWMRLSAGHEAASCGTSREGQALGWGSGSCGCSAQRPLDASHSIIAQHLACRHPAPSSQLQQRQQHPPGPSPLAPG